MLAPLFTNVASAMIWDASPIAFSLELGPLQFAAHWYGLLFASTFIYGMVFFRYIYRTENRPEDAVYDLVLYVIGGTVIGARLGHVLFYDPAYFLANPLEILKIWQGGLASHGALIGILLGVWLYSRSEHGEPFLWVCDRIGMAVPLSGCLIRIGNFFNSEILGLPTQVPWAVTFANIDRIPRHPVQIYEALAYLAIFLIQLRHYLRYRGASPPGLLMGRFLLLVFGARFILEFFKEEQAAFDSLGGLTQGQWLSLPAMLAGLWLVRRASWPTSGPVPR